MLIFKIDEVAKQTGLTQRTIRYYEQIGLLPSPPRTVGGTRYYSQEHIDLFKKITNARDVMGFTLQELQEFISLEDTLLEQRTEYRTTTSESVRLNKLQDLLQTIEKQLTMIKVKKEKISNLENELLNLSDRVKKFLGNR